MKFFVKDSERKPDPEPIKTNARAVALAGLVIWVVALAVLLIFPSVLPPEKTWWLGTCVVGFFLGLFFYIKLRRGQ